MVDVVEIFIVNRNVRAFGTVVATAQPRELHFCFQSVVCQKFLNEFKVFGIAAGKAGTAHADFYGRTHVISLPNKVYIEKII